MIIEQFLVHNDNYATLLHDPYSNVTISIDAPDFTTIDACLMRHNWRLNGIFVTHCHQDHIEGIPQLWQKYSPALYVPFLEAWPFNFPYKTLINNDSYFIADRQLIALETPGHSTGSFSYYCPTENAIFVGDVLFSLGCGRVEHQAYDSMFYSLNKLRQLDDKTRLYCGHDYTYINTKFAIALEPNNSDLLQFQKEIEKAQKLNQLLPPSTLKQEKKLNPFLRWDDLSLRKNLHMEKATNLEVFTTLRKMRDYFKD